MLHLRATGSWLINAATGLGSKLNNVATAGTTQATFDLSNMTALDSTGALILQKLIDRLEVGGCSVEIDGLRDEHRPLLDYAASLKKADPLTEPDHYPLLAMVERLGRGAVAACHEARNLTNFLGMAVVSAFRNLLNPGQIRFVSVISHIEQTGLNALPIVGLLSFLIGVVLAFQGADQLTRFGADIFTVNLLGVSIFREMQADPVALSPLSLAPCRSIRKSTRCRRWGSTQSIYWCCRGC